MKKNNRGFMLVEVIIVAVVVATIMTSLFVVFNRVYNAYDTKSKYTDIDSIYALKMIEDYLIDNFKINELIKNTTNYSVITCEEVDTYCNSVFNEYNVNSMYIVKNDETSLNDLKNNVSNQTFKEYIDYLMNIGIYTKNFLGENKIYSELLVVETYTVDDDENILNKYAYLPIRIVESE